MKGGRCGTRVAGLAHYGVPVAVETLCGSWTSLLVLVVRLGAREVLANQVLGSMELRALLALSVGHLPPVAALQAVSLSVCQSVSCPVARMA